MNKERIDDLIDILADEYAKLENTFVIKNNQQLAKYLDNPSEWIASQLNDRADYLKTLTKEAREQLAQLNAKTEKVFLLSYREVAKDQIEVTKFGIVAHNIPKEVREQIKNLKKFNAEQIARLANATLNMHTSQVNIISALQSPDQFYDVVKMQMQKGIANGVKIQYRDGKQFTWKSYMEMNIRTTIHQEMSNNQVEVGAKVGQIFYVCDSFADSADDHAPMQSKIYFNEKATIPQEVAEWIKQHNIMSMQTAMGAPYYLTTRPNCRHNFHAIPLEEAMGMSAKSIVDKYNLSTGKYKASNYQKLQEQRKNERMIRKFKLRAKNQQEVNKSVGKRGWLGTKHNLFYMRKWQEKQRKLIKDNPDLLKRDYDRENAEVITQDLGVRYDYSFKDGKIEEK